MNNAKIVNIDTFVAAVRVALALLILTEAQKQTILVQLVNALP